MLGADKFIAFILRCISKGAREPDFAGVTQLLGQDLAGAEGERSLP